MPPPSSSESVLSLNVESVTEMSPAVATPPPPTAVFAVTVTPAERDRVVGILQEAAAGTLSVATGDGDVLQGDLVLRVEHAVGAGLLDGRAVALDGDHAVDLDVAGLAVVEHVRRARLEHDRVTVADLVLEHVAQGVGVPVGDRGVDRTDRGHSDSTRRADRDQRADADAERKRERGGAAQDASRDGPCGGHVVQSLSGAAPHLPRGVESQDNTSTRGVRHLMVASDPPARARQRCSALHAPRCRRGRGRGRNCDHCVHLDRAERLADARRTGTAPAPGLLLS